MYKNEFFFVENGDLQEFRDIILLLLNLTPSEDSYTCFNIREDSSLCRDFFVPSNISIIKDIHHYYQPRMIKQNSYYHEITIKFKMEHLKFFYPVARKRIDLKLWLKDILLQRNIAEDSIDTLF